MKGPDSARASGQGSAAGRHQWGLVNGLGRTSAWFVRAAVTGTQSEIRPGTLEIRPHKCSLYHVSGQAAVVPSTSRSPIGRRRKRPRSG